MKIRKLKINEILAIITAVLLTVGTVVFKPPWYEIMPMYISIIVMFLQTNVNRYAFLLGGFNSLLYAVADIALTLYSSAAQALIVSFPFQIATFVTWSKNTVNGQTAIKRFSDKGRFYLFLIMLLSWIFLYAVFSFFHSKYLLLDNTAAVFAIVATVLNLLRYCEAAILSLIGCIINIILFAQVIINSPEKCIWMVYTVYSSACVIIAFIKMNKRSAIKAKL